MRPAYYIPPESEDDRVAAFIEARTQARIQAGVEPKLARKLANLDERWVHCRECFDEGCSKCNP